MKTTERQRRFVDYYLELGNQVQAAIRAGYSGRYARDQAFKILEMPAVKEYYEDRLQEIESKRVANIKEVMEYLTSVMRGEETEEMIVVEGCGNGYSEARKINKSIGAKDRLKAAELIGKRYMMFTDKVELDSDMNLNITIDYGEDDPE